MSGFNGSGCDYGSEGEYARPEDVRKFSSRCQECGTGLEQPKVKATETSEYEFWWEHDEQ